MKTLWGKIGDGRLAVPVFKDYWQRPFPISGSAGKVCPESVAGSIVQSVQKPFPIDQNVDAMRSALTRLYKLLAKHDHKPRFAFSERWTGYACCLPASMPCEENSNASPHENEDQCSLKDISHASFKAEALPVCKFGKSSCVLTQTIPRDCDTKDGMLDIGYARIHRSFNDPRLCWLRCSAKRLGAGGNRPYHSDGNKGC